MKKTIYFVSILSILFGYNIFASNEIEKVKYKYEIEIAPQGDSLQLMITGGKGFWPASSTFSSFVYHLIHGTKSYDTSVAAEKLNKRTSFSGPLFLRNKQNVPCLPIFINELQEYLNYNFALGEKYTIYVSPMKGQNEKSNELEFKVAAKPLNVENKGTAKTNIPLGLKIDWQQNSHDGTFIIVTLLNNSAKDFIWTEVNPQNMFKFKLYRSAFVKRETFITAPDKTERSSKKVTIGAGKELSYKYKLGKVWELLLPKDQPLVIKSKYLLSVSLEDNINVPANIQKLHSNELPFVIFLEKMSK